MSDFDAAFLPIISESGDLESGGDHTYSSPTNFESIGGVPNPSPPSKLTKSDKKQVLTASDEESSSESEVLSTSESDTTSESSSSEEEKEEKEEGKTAPKSRKIRKIKQSVTPEKEEEEEEESEEEKSEEKEEKSEEETESETESEEESTVNLGTSANPDEIYVSNLTDALESLT